MERALRETLPYTNQRRLREKHEGVEPSVRAKPEHSFDAIKNLPRHRKARYRGLDQNPGEPLRPIAFKN